VRFHLLSRDVERANITRELRLRTLFLAASFARTVPGDYAEVGVYKGRSAVLLARSAPEKTLHLFDTFTGMPMSDDETDGHKIGDFSDTSLESVRQRVGDKNVKYHVGVFPGTADPVRDVKFAFAHYDGDLYLPCVDFIKFFRPRMSRGGIMAFDDYDWPKCLGVKRAIEEAGLEVIEAVDYQAFVVKA
jgi:hypothetical protein